MALGFLAWAGKEALSLGTSLLKKKAEKPKKKSGKEMASAIIKREDKPKAIVKSISTTKLLSTKSVTDIKPQKLSKDSSGVSAIDVALDRIDSVLVECIETIQASDKIKKNILSQEKKKEDKKKKKKRERTLEMGDTILSNVKSGISSLKASDIGRNLTNYFGNVIMGSIVLGLINIWRNIVDWFKKAWEVMKKALDILEGIATWLWNAAKWIVGEDAKNLMTETEDLLKKMRGIESEEFDNSELATQIDAINQESEKIKKESEGIKNTIDEIQTKGAEGNVNNIKNFTNTSSSGDSNTSQSSEVSQAGRSIQRSPFSSGVNNISQTFNIKSEPMVGTAIQDSSGKIIGYYNNMNTKVEFSHPDLASSIPFTIDKNQLTSSSLMTHTSYEMDEGTTVVMITGNDSLPQNSGEGGIKFLPLFGVNSNDYTLAFRTGLQKFG